MDRSKKVIKCGLPLILLGMLFSGCKKVLRIEEVFQIYFAPKNIIVLSDEHETTWQYIKVYNSSLTVKEFEYSSPTNKIFSIDSMSGNQIFVSVVKYDLSLSKNRTENKYSLFRKGKYDLFVKVLHLGGAGNNNDMHLSFLNRNGNILRFKQDSVGKGLNIDLKNIAFDEGIPCLRVIDSNSSWSRIILKDSINFVAFKKSLMLQ